MDRALGPHLHHHTQRLRFVLTASVRTRIGPRSGMWSTPLAKAACSVIAVAIFPKDLSHPPRSWAERTYHVTRYTVMPRGGHFAAHEEPALLVDDLTEFFRPLR